MSKPARGPLLLALLLLSACSSVRVAPPSSPFPPRARWEHMLEVPLASAPASDGTLFFTASSDGSVSAWDAVAAAPLWTRPGTSPGFLVARAGVVLFIEKTGAVWSLSPEDGSARWKKTLGVSDVESVRLDGNRLFIGGNGLASLLASTGEVRFDLPAKVVRHIDVAGDFLVALEEGALVQRGREDGVVRYRLASPEGEFGAPALFSDGRVVVGSGHRLVRAVSTKGDFKWRFKVGARVRDRPLDYGDLERVGVLSFEGVFYELSLGGGDMRRRALFSSRPFGPPTLIEGRIFVPVSEDEVVVLDPRTTKIIGKARFGGGFLSLPVFSGGRLLAEVASPRRLVALETAPLG